MESKILRKDVNVRALNTNGGTPPPPLPANITLLEGLETRTFEVEGNREISLLAIATIEARNRQRQCVGDMGLCNGFATYELSKTCGIDGKQYIKKAECKGLILDPTFGTPPPQNHTEVECTAEGNTKTIFVMD
jgi:hypothetical protein